MLRTELLASTAGLAEAPTRVGEDIWFTDLTEGVLRVSPEGTAPELLLPRRGVGGLVPHVSGGVIASGRSLVHVTEDGTITEICSRPLGSTGFNDIDVTDEGNVLAGLLRYRPLAGDEPSPGALMEVSSTGLKEVVAGPTWPNGIAAVRDGSGAAYLADFNTGTILRVSPEGRADVLVTLDEGFADGLSLDTTGRLWVATGPGATLVAITPRGEVDMRIALDAAFVSSLALGGDGAEALVTVGTTDGRGALLVANLKAQGLPTALATIGAITGED